jgi:hypothetical protein
MLVDGLVRVRSGSGRAASAAVSVSLFGLFASGAGAGTDLSFTEVSLSRGVNYIVGTPAIQFGAGHGLIDLDNDGHLDIVILGAANGLVGVYENNGSGSFINRSFATGIAPMTAAAGVSAADYDGDGDVDLFLSGWHVSNRLLRNNGNFNFTDVTLSAGVQLSCPSQATSWSDFNGDGWLDLYLTVRTGDLGDITRNKLYQNLGNGTFTEVASAVGVEAGSDPTLLPAFFDFDRDGDDDLYLGTDKGSNGGLDQPALPERLGRVRRDHKHRQCAGLCRLHGDRHRRPELRRLLRRVSDQHRPGQQAPHARRGRCLCGSDRLGRHAEPAVRLGDRLRRLQQRHLARYLCLQSAEHEQAVRGGPRVPLRRCRVRGRCRHPQHQLQRLGRRHRRRRRSRHAGRRVRHPHQAVPQQHPRDQQPCPLPGHRAGGGTSMRSARPWNWTSRV